MISDDNKNRLGSINIADKNKLKPLKLWFPIEAMENKAFQSHSHLSSEVVPQGLDLVRPFSHRVERVFSPNSCGYSSGKIPAGHNKIYFLDLFEWIQSPERGCYRSLAVALRRKISVNTLLLLLFSIQRCWKRNLRHFLLFFSFFPPLCT